LIVAFGGAARPIAHSASTTAIAYVARRIPDEV